MDRKEIYLMIVTIAGCGALGGVIAAHLIRGGVSVQAFQRKGRTLEVLKEKGITLLSENGKTAPACPFTAVSDDPGDLLPTGLILVLVKAYQTGSISPLKGLLSPEGIVLTVQNGLGNAEKLCSIFGEKRVAAGITTYGGIRLSPGVVREGLQGSITFGPWSGGKTNRYQRIERLLADAGLRVVQVSDPRPLLWKKLSMNVMANPVFALTRMSVGQVANNPFALDLMKKVGREAVEAAARAGVIMDFQENWQFFMKNLDRAPDHKPSMLQDMEAGRKMEIESILGSVLSQASNEEDFPYTRSLYNLLSAIDRTRGHYQKNPD